ncbi:DUF190 domain-containing protein [Trichothermofontia sp.]
MAMREAQETLDAIVTAEQLTIYVAEGAQTHGQLTYEVLLDMARQMGIAGMTVLRSAVGYSQRHGHISVDWVMEMAPDLIMILIVIDHPTAIAQFLTQIRPLITTGLVVKEPILVMHHAPDIPLKPQLPISPLSDPPYQEITMSNFERLTIYVGESDQWQGKPIHLALVEAAHKQGLMGATVVRGVMGYGKQSHHQIKLLGIIEFSSDLPMVATVIDHTEKIEQFLPIVQTMVMGGIVVREPIAVVHHAPLDQHQSGSSNQ